MSEGPRLIWVWEGIHDSEGWHGSAMDVKVGENDIPYRRADTVVDRAVADKMAAALRRVDKRLNAGYVAPAGIIHEEARAALAAYVEATNDAERS